MFACVYGRSVSKAATAEVKNGEGFSPLIDLAFTFSPLVEQTAPDTVVFDIAGQDLLFGTSSITASEPSVSGDSALNIAKEIARRALEYNLKINIAIAANPDAAIHAAQCFKGITIIDAGDEWTRLAPLSIKNLSHSLAQIDPARAGEIQETFRLWGVRTFGDVARLPLAGVAERLGQAGVRLQRLAQGKTDRKLNLVRPPIGFEQSLELEHPICELEPLTFVLSRLLNQLCANLNEYALATNELRLRLVSERGQWSVASSQESGDRRAEGRGQLLGSSLRLPISPSPCLPSDHRSLAADHYLRTLTLPVPLRNPKTLLRLLLFEIEREPPQSPISAVVIRAEPVKPRAAQTGLFIPLAPEPEKLEITLARLAKLVGAENVGAPEILDTHRPDAFRMKRFTLKLNHRGHRGRKSKAGIKTFNRQSAIGNRQCVMGFRVFRPPWIAEIQTLRGRPTRISARSSPAGKVRGQIICASGPWRTSGEWWRPDVWARDEWDVAVVDSTSPEREVLCRLYRDLVNEQWFVAGIYD
jgi:protein ImuB